ncbi:uncharacterized protein C7orf43 homolog [Alligator sinensis]|uniref:Uncharacterized protein C7orf43 homolog n=1 Tax=Alligator sinensis TaxID=38654 RepID=A0A3Q0H4A7_ALLSI|nr:uncharacterized protein C7orf43 homolog [Alligator sinensis]
MTTSLRYIRCSADEPVPAKRMRAWFARSWANAMRRPYEMRGASGGSCLHSDPLHPQIVVTVWKRDREQPEVRDCGYLSLLQTRAPAQLFRQEQGAFKAQVSTMLTVLPPPVVKCRQLSVSGKYLTVLKVLNRSSLEEISVRDVRILPNFNASYLPVMPDGSVLLVDNVCHHSGEVPVGAFCRVPGAGAAPPCALRALEEQSFLFQLHAPQQPPPDAKEGLEVPLVAVVQWSTPKLPFTSSIYTHYRLPSIRLERPRFVMTAAVESPVLPRQRFTVTYTLLNDLQDFLAVRLVWAPEGAAAGAGKVPPGSAPGPGSGPGRRAAQAALDSLVCHTPLARLGHSRKGSALTGGGGVWEVGPAWLLPFHLPITASAVPLEWGLGVSPVLGDPGGDYGKAVGRLKLRVGSDGKATGGQWQGGGTHRSVTNPSFPRSGSVMERRAITPPVGSPVGRPLYLPPDKAVLSLDKIAKRECKVLVVEPVM